MRRVWILLVALANVIGTGCAKLPIPDAQFLPTPLIQSADYAAPPDLVWQVVSEAGRSAARCGVLADSPSSRLIAWCEPAAGWRDLGQDLAAPKYQVTKPNDPNHFQKFAQTTGDGYALTTIWVEDLGHDRARVQVRRVYLGAKSLPGLGHSRGDFERAFNQSIATQVNMRQTFLSTQKNREAALPSPGSNDVAEPTSPLEMNSDE